MVLRALSSALGATRRLGESKLGSENCGGIFQQFALPPILSQFAEAIRGAAFRTDTLFVMGAEVVAAVCAKTTLGGHHPPTQAAGI